VLKQLIVVTSLLPEQGMLAGLASCQCPYSSLAGMGKGCFSFCFYFPLELLSISEP